MIYSTTSIELHCGSETPEDSVRVLSAVLQSRIIKAAMEFEDDYRLPQGVAVVFEGRRMAETKFTPGPWIAQPNHVIEGPHAERGIWPVAEAAFRETAEEIQANALLIAAAPEMHEALEFVKNWLARLEDGTPIDDALYAIRKRAYAPLHAVIDAALAKACGGSEVTHAI